MARLCEEQQRASDTPGKRARLSDAPPGWMLDRAALLTDTQTFGVLCEVPPLAGIAPAPSPLDAYLSSAIAGLRREQRIDDAGYSVRAGGRD